jgi:hypothetical protein
VAGCGDANSKRAVGAAQHARGGAGNDAGAAAASSVGATDVLAPLLGRLYTHAPGQESLQFYGTDLGLPFVHGGQIRVLFGDSYTGPTTEPAGHDDVQGVIALDQFSRGDDVDTWIAAHPPASGALSWQRAGPPLTVATDPSDASLPSFIHVAEGSTDLDLGQGKAPLAAFSDGSDRAFGIFYVGATEACRTAGTVEPECPNGLECDRAADGQGTCVDPTSSVFNAGDGQGRKLAQAQRLAFGVSEPARPEYYESSAWVTNKFINPSARTVRRFDIGSADSRESDFHYADGTSGDSAKILVWGRPTFVGNQATQHEARLYFLFADLPSLDAAGLPSWNPRYFSGLDGEGVPQFSAQQSDAVALDLAGGADASHEAIDIVNQMSVTWVEPFHKWVMIYGGDVSPILITYFNPGAKETRDRALQIRYADVPWGPWSEPEPIVRAVAPDVAGSHFARGGVLFHESCRDDDCVEGDPSAMGEMGRFYAPNVYDVWTEPREHGADIYWTVSTWNPYAVVLLKTRLEPPTIHPHASAR